MDSKYYIDVSKRALLELKGPDGLDLLQRISTNEVSHLKVGEHVETLLTTDKGRIVDFSVVFRSSPDSIILAGNSTETDVLKKWIERFIVMEDVRSFSLSDKAFQILLFSIKNMELTPQVNATNLYMARLNSLSPERALLVGSMDDRAELISILEKDGFVRAKEKDYESFRVENGIPGFPNELSSSFNPLEIGLRSVISFTKGCYVGQEVIARLDTYDKVQKTLRKLWLSAAPSELPSDLFDSLKEKAGVLTSCIESSTEGNGFLGLGLISAGHTRTDLTYSQHENDLVGRAQIIS